MVDVWRGGEGWQVPMEINDSAVVDYSWALAVASLVVGIVLSMLPRKPSDGVARLLLFAGNLAAVLYVAWSNGALDLTHSALVYVALAAGVPSAHYLYKLTPGQQEAPVDTGAPETVTHGPVAPLSGVDSVAAQKVIQQALSGLPAAG